MFSPGRPGPGRRLRRQGLARPCGTSCSTSGTQADGLYLGLGIGDYSDAVRRARPRPSPPSAARTSSRSTCPTEYGFDIETGAAAARRAPCSACGLSKRHLFNQAALDGGYDVVATGHNLDDEAAVLFGNILRWDAEYLGRQLPVLPAGDGFVARSSRWCG